MHTSEFDAAIIRGMPPGWVNWLLVKFIKKAILVLNYQRRYLALMPVFGFCVFVILYLIAAFYYPGGSDINQQADKFSWLNNYWCDLLEDTSENGSPNTAKPVAMLGMVVLCITLIIFWLIIPGWLPIQQGLMRIIQVTGAFSMVILIFLNTSRHDLIINGSTVFGLSAMSLVLYGLLRGRLFKLFGMGMLCIALTVFNTIIYYSHIGVQILPLVQKITFLVIMIWFSLVSWTVSSHSINNRWR